MKNRSPRLLPNITRRMLPFADAASSDFPLGQIVEVISIPNICRYGERHALGYIKPCNDCRA